MASNYTVYAAGPSFFSAKLRAYLDFKALPYQQVTASAKVYKTIIKPKTGLNVIPVLATPDGQFVQDTQEIISYLEQQHTTPPVTSKLAIVEFLGALYEMLIDEWFLVYAMHYRWSYADNFFQLYEEFGATAFPHFPRFLQRFVGKKVGLRFSGFCPALGVNESTKADFEKRFELQIAILNEHFKSFPYLLGSQVCVGDFSLAGAFNGHLLHDRYPTQLIRERAPQLEQGILGLSNPPTQQPSIASLADIPESSIRFLRQLYYEFSPVLNATLTAYCQWAEKQTVESYVPRALGNIKVRLESGEVMERKALSFCLWKLQGVLSQYDKLDSDDQSTIKGWLVDFDPESLKKDLGQFPMTRKNNRVTYLGR